MGAFMGPCVSWKIKRFEEIGRSVKIKKKTKTNKKQTRKIRTNTNQKKQTKQENVMKTMAFHENTHICEENECGQERSAPQTQYTPMKQNDNNTNPAEKT